MGPLGFRQLRALWRKGIVAASTRVWAQEWGPGAAVQASSVPGLVEALQGPAAAPPAAPAGAGGSEAAPAAPFDPEEEEEDPAADADRTLRKAAEARLRAPERRGGAPAPAAGPGPRLVELELKTRQLRAAEAELDQLRRALRRAERDKEQAREVAIALRKLLQRAGASGPANGGSPGQRAGQPPPPPPEADPDFTLPPPPAADLLHTAWGLHPPGPTPERAPRPPSGPEMLGELGLSQHPGRRALADLSPPGRRAGGPARAGGGIPRYQHATTNSAVKRAEREALSPPAEGGRAGAATPPPGGSEAGLLEEVRTIGKKLAALERQSANSRDLQSLKHQVQGLRAQNERVMHALSASKAGTGSGGPAAASPAFPLPADFASVSPVRFPAASPERKPSPGGGAGGARPLPAELSYRRRPSAFEKGFALKPKAQDVTGQIDRAIVKLKAKFKENGIALPLKRLHDRVYSLAGKKVNLLVIGGKLCVRTGGGPSDFLQYLSQKKLRISQWVEEQQAAGAAGGG